MVKFTDPQKYALKLHAASAILSGHNTAWTKLRAGLSPQHEPVFVAHLCQSLSQLATPWRAELRQIDPSARLSICSVFTHQKPYVTYTINSKTEVCELSDVMIALIDRSDPANVRSRCIFVQAKRDDLSTVTLKDVRDKVQLDLYTIQPNFDVKRAHAPKMVAFPHVGHATGLNYGITPPSNISSKAPPAAWGNNRWLVANCLKGHPDFKVTASIPLQDLLVDLLGHSAGFAFELSKPGASWRDQKSTDNWSALINFILQDVGSAKSQSYAQPYWSHRTDGERVLSFSNASDPGIPLVTINDVLPNSHPRPRQPSFGMSLLDKLLAKRHSPEEPPNIDFPRHDGDSDDGEWGGISVVVVEMSARGD